jgi:glycosyltransferase involved in cell wall biosynthesis
MACGTVAVVSNNSSLREIVDSSAILINDPLDPKEISTRILEALEEEDKSDLKRRAIRQAQKFTWENTVQKTIAAYDKVVQM